VWRVLAPGFDACHLCQGWHAHRHLFGFERARATELANAGQDAIELTRMRTDAERVRSPIPRQPSAPRSSSNRRVDPPESWILVHLTRCPVRAQRLDENLRPAPDAADGLCCQQPFHQGARPAKPAEHCAMLVRTSSNSSRGNARTPAFCLSRSVIRLTRCASSGKVPKIFV